MAAPNTFEGARLDRVTARRRDRDWVAAQAADPASRAVVAGPDGVLVDGDALALVPLDGLGEPLLLGVQDGRALFAADGEGRSDLVSVRAIAPSLAQDEGGLLAYAAALLNWHRRHRFCSVCGTASQVREAGLVRVWPGAGGGAAARVPGVRRRAPPAHGPGRDHVRRRWGAGSRAAGPPGGVAGGAL